MTDTSDISSLITESATRIFHDRCDPQAINNAKGVCWKEPLWRDMEENGLTLSWVDEERGGAGVGIAAGFDVLYVSGKFAVPAPLGETMLAGWLLSQAGIAIPKGPMSVAPCVRQDRISIDGKGALSGTARSVPFANETRHLVLLVQGEDAPAAALVETKHCNISEGASIAGDPQGDVTFEGVAPSICSPLPLDVGSDALMLLGAAVRARQIAGGLQAILDLAVEYAKERIAFGRPIGKFQAVQHNLARLAGEVAAADAASGSAADAIHHAECFDDAVFLEVAAAKIRAGEAAGEGAAIAHQVFGAIGFTQEHILQRYTRRLWAWRDDFGTESEWAEQLGRRIAAAGADQLWPILAAR